LHTLLTGTNFWGFRLRGKREFENGASQESTLWEFYITKGKLKRWVWQNPAGKQAAPGSSSSGRRTLTNHGFRPIEVREIAGHKGAKELESKKRFRAMDPGGSTLEGDLGLHRILLVWGFCKLGTRLVRTSFGG